ncbi:unnamed protein product [Arctogadus glacialis]
MNQENLNQVMNQVYHKEESLKPVHETVKPDTTSTVGLSSVGLSSVGLHGGKRNNVSSASTLSRGGVAPPDSRVDVNVLVSDALSLMVNNTWPFGQRSLTGNRGPHWPGHRGHSRPEPDARLVDTSGLLCPYAGDQSELDGKQPPSQRWRLRGDPEPPVGPGRWPTGR